MQPENPSTGTRRPSRTLVAAGVVVALVVVAVVGGAGLVYFFGQSVPAAVSLPSAAASSGAAAAAPSAAPAATTSAVAPTAGPSPSSGASSSAPAGPGATGTSSLTGTWKVDNSIGSFSDFSDSFVGYRVAENLANVGSTTAVGRTPNVTGSLTVAGDSITAATVKADLSTLQSDRPQRDGQLHQQALQTDAYPTATFVLATRIALAHLPAEGETISATAIGDLTLHGVTKRVSMPLQAKLAGGVVTVVGSLPIAFADYAIRPPQSMMVLSVADSGTLELQLHFTPGQA